MRLGCRVEQIDVRRRVVRLEGGEELSYERLVNTLPLPQFLRMMCGGPGGLDGLAEDLDWSVVACLNLGVDRADIGDGAHWIYFPDEDVPFYRVGFPSNFSSSVAPEGCGSMYVEFGLGRDEPFDPEDLARRGIEALRAQGILAQDDRILVRDLVRIDPGYVIFDRSRQKVMKRVIPELEDLAIHSIGRYGAWTYSYMERALLDGLELAHKLRHENC
jgi:UDP-galactopyranose mutase